MNYTLHQLQIFLAVVKYENVTKAAREMHLTQPALSIQLKNFQMQFEIPLTEVIGKKLFVTDFGKEISEIASNIINEAEQLKYKTSEYKGLLSGKLNISSVSTGKYVIPFFLSEFLQDHPGIDLEMDVSNKTQVINELTSNQSDFALVSVVPEDLDVEEELLFENRLFFVANHPTTHDDAPLIYREKGSATRAAMNSYFEESPKTRKSLTLTSNEAVKQAVIAGIGNSILPLVGILNALENDKLFIIPKEGLPITTFWRLIWLKGKKLPPVAEEFLKYVQTHKKRIVHEHFKWSLNTF